MPNKTSPNSSARTGAERAVILGELRSGKKEANRGVLIMFASGGGVTAMAAGLSLVVPSVFGPMLPGVIALVGAATSLASLLPKAKAAKVVSANYDLAGRYTKMLERGKDV